MESKSNLIMAFSISMEKAAGVAQSLQAVMLSLRYGKAIESSAWNAILRCVDATVSPDSAQSVFNFSFSAPNGLLKK